MQQSHKCKHTNYKTKPISPYPGMHQFQDFIGWQISAGLLKQDGVYWINGRKGEYNGSNKAKYRDDKRSPMPR
jgi:hypothetical protein